MKSKILLFALPLLALFTAPLFAQDEAAATDEQAEAQAQWDAFMQSLAWKHEGAGDLEQWATIEIPEGYRYLNGEDANRLMQAYGNLPSE